MKEGLLRIGAVVLSAMLMILAFPPFEWWGLVVVSLLLFLGSLRGVSGQVGFRLGLLWGVIVFSGTLIWLLQVFRFPAIGLWVMLALFCGGFGAVYAALVEKREVGWVTGLFAAVLWVGWEYYRCEWYYLRFPWITPGTALPPTVLTSMVGVYGLSFLLVLSVAWVLEPVKRVRVAGGGLALGILVLTMVSLKGGAGDGEVRKDGIKVALIQSEEGVFARYLKMSEEEGGAATVFVWPEYAVSYDVRKYPSDMASLKGLISEPGQFVVLGSRTDLADDAFQNTAVTIGAEGVLGSHVKNRPVHFFNDGEAGRDPQPVETPFGKMGTPICFDCDYEAVIRQLTQRGATFFLVPSMDEESWTDRQHEQHARLFRQRAAENGRWIAVAATSGVTQIIDPKGRVQGRLPTMEEGVLTGVIYPETGQTLFTRVGWLLGPTCVVFTLAYLVALLPWVRRWSVSPT